MSYYFIEDREKIPDITLWFNAEKHEFSKSEGTPSDQYYMTRLHNHDVMEILCVLNGKMSVIVRDRQYYMQPGECVVCSPYDLHEIRVRYPDSPLSYLCLTIDLKMTFRYPDSVLCEQIEALLEEDQKFSVYYPSGEEDTEALCDYCRIIHDCFRTKTSSSECQTLSALYAVFQLLFDRHIEESNILCSKKRDIEFMKKITLYLQDNYKNNISTADAAASMFMSTTQFCRAFRRHYDLSFTNYLCRYRIHTAVREFIGCYLPITAIANEVGFSSYNHFSHSFHKYMGVSPAVYFGKWKNRGNTEQNETNP